MKPEKKKVMFLFILFLIMVCMFTSYAGYNYYDILQKKSDFRTYEISGHIHELILVTDFPNEGLYVGFDNGDYRFIDINYWWAYASLSLIQPQNNVTIEYERNYYSNTRALHIEEVEVNGS